MRGHVLSVFERDFHVAAPTTVSAGDVELLAHNEGPDEHELIVVRTDQATLPLRADGITVDEDTLDGQTIGAIEPYRPGSSVALHLHLLPGHYVFICNMFGHYLGGMRADLTVV
jgi:uncharacterized cupredoxin-like copper-binding protein